MSDDTCLHTYKLDDLLRLMARLREPEKGCPWDLQQTYRSLVPSTLEEAYEVVDAIERGDYSHLKEELGDLLFQVIFYSQLGAEDGFFDFAEIVSMLVAKLLRRHPHIFPQGTLESQIKSGSESQANFISSQWEQIKAEERRAQGEDRILANIPRALPALTRAGKLQKRAANVGFDWPQLAQVVIKLEEELLELQQALVEGEKEEITAELGDVFFTLVNVSRHLSVDPEMALRLANRKFEQRFELMEAEVAKKGLRMEDLSIEQLNTYWEKAKQAN